MSFSPRGINLRVPFGGKNNYLKIYWPGKCCLRTSQAYVSCMVSGHQRAGELCRLRGHSKGLGVSGLQKREGALKGQGGEQGLC